MRSLQEVDLLSAPRCMRQAGAGPLSTAPRVLLGHLGAEKKPALIADTTRDESRCSTKSQEGAEM